MSQVERELRILEALENNPETTQANLATQLGMAVGSVNLHLKRLIRRGYVKATKMERRRLKYFVTPQGLAVKARLTSKYMEASLRVYRELRQAARETLAQIRDAGYMAVELNGKNEATEIFGLTCLEEGVGVENNPSSPLPQVQAEGTRFVVEWPAERQLDRDVRREPCQSVDHAVRT
jgi:DNA-binding MarR family transcriptional regulator